MFAVDDDARQASLHEVRTITITRDKAARAQDDAPRGVRATLLLPGLLALLVARCTPAPPEPTLAEKALAIAAVFETTHPYSARTVDSLGLTAFFDKYPGYRSDSASVMDFYRRRAMQFAWIVRDSLSASAGAFVALAGVAHTGDTEADAQGGQVSASSTTRASPRAPAFPRATAAPSTWSCGSPPSSSALPIATTGAI